MQNLLSPKYVKKTIETQNLDKLKEIIECAKSEKNSSWVNRKYVVKGESTVYPGGRGPAKKIPWKRDEGNVLNLMLTHDNTFVAGALELLTQYPNLEINHIDQNLGEAPLHRAVDIGNITLVNKLLKLGANVNIETTDDVHEKYANRTPIFLAILSATHPKEEESRKRVEILELLLKNGAKANFENNNRYNANTPLHLVYYYFSNKKIGEQLFKLLSQYGADPKKLIDEDRKKWANNMMLKLFPDNTSHSHTTFFNSGNKDTGANQPKQNENISCKRKREETKDEQEEIEEDLDRFTKDRKLK